MKIITLKLPFSNKTFSLTGDNNDKSIFTPIETSLYYSPHITNFLKGVLKKDSISIDIGANIGAISLVMSYLSPMGKVYSFEPANVNFLFLEKNLLLNNIKNVEPIKAAIFDKNQQITLSYVEFGGGWSYIKQDKNLPIYDLIKEYFGEEWIENLKNNQLEVKEELVDCLSLDEWVEKSQLKRIDLIKVDVEGSEINVLNGARKTIKKLRPDLIVEFNPKVYKILYEENPIKLYSTLCSKFPYIYSISFDDSSLTFIKDYDHLLDCIKRGRRQLVDLYCTFKQRE